MDLLKSLLIFTIPSVIAVMGFPIFALLIYLYFAFNLTYNFVSYHFKTYP